MLRVHPRPWFNDSSWNFACIGEPRRLTRRIFGKRKARLNQPRRWTLLSAGERYCFFSFSIVAMTALGPFPS
jgi:hypothetical protein